MKLRSRVATFFSEDVMKKILYVSILSLFCFFSANAETHISGDIRVTTFDSTGNPYIIDQDIIIPAGKKLTIKEGCIFLFKGFTGINVYGQINVAGTAKRPVVFTSVNDPDFNPKSDQQPNPFDWNGILIARESSGALIDNIHLRYSVYGIKSQNTNITIQNGLFRQNGQFHFTVNDKIQYVQDNISYSYSGAAGAKESDRSVDLSDDGAKKPDAKKAKTGNGAVVFRYTSLGVGVVGLAAGSYFLWKFIPVNNDLKLSTGEFSKKYPENTQKKWNTMNNSFDSLRWGTGIAYGLGALGLLCFGISFAF
jgi:hypothetical protein